MDRQFIFRIVHRTRIPLVVRQTLQRRKVTILVYHDPGPSTMEDHLRVLGKHYSFISLASFRDAFESHTVRNLPAKSLIVTLDDGHRNNYALTDIFKRFGVTPTIFLCTGIVDTHRHFWFKDVGNSLNYKRISDNERLRKLEHAGFEEERVFLERQALSKAEIDEMKGVVDFQSHTVSHPVLCYCSNAKAAREIAESKRTLEREYGVSVYAISYPNGDYSDREISLARESGYTLGLSVDAGFNSRATERFRLKRIPIPDDASVDELLVRACGMWEAAKTLTRRRDYGYVRSERFGGRGMHSA